MSKIRDVPDFPIPGILFKDITTMLKDGPAFSEIIDTLVKRYQGKDIDAVVAIESRGYIFGAPLAAALKVGFVPIRKPGKLPAEKISVEYETEYSKEKIEMHTDAIQPGQRVVIVDDLMATGGSGAAIKDLVERLGGKVVEFAFIIELSFLNGREKLKGYDIFTMMTF
ncbi:MAG: adenine phosphoribosyltransferase [Firmicutes bacterium]|nr:adenine phosphoribosyltransferase [Bacillota bacterium]